MFLQKTWVFGFHVISEMITAPEVECNYINYVLCKLHIHFLSWQIKIKLLIIL